MEKLLGGDIPAETKATCDDCAMCDKGPETSVPDGYYFKPDVKCWSYVPYLPNVRIGGVLSDQDPSLATGKERIRQRIQARKAVTPFGMGQPPGYDRKYRKEWATFGRNRSLICPFFVDEGGGKCSVWKYRESTCTTWFCKFVRGKTGHEFWKSLQHLLHWIEKALSRWCAKELKLDSPGLRRVFTGSGKDRGIDGPFRMFQLNEEGNAERHREVWGNWNGREEEFYRESARLAAELSWTQVVEITGQQTAYTAMVVQEAYRKLVSREIPVDIRLGSFRKDPLEPGKWQIITHSPIDPVAMPQDILDLLVRFFDGRSTQEALDTMLEEENTQFSEDLLHQLIDWGILTSQER